MATKKKQPENNGIIEGFDAIKAIEVSQDGQRMFMLDALNTAIQKGSIATERYGKKSKIKLDIVIEKREHGVVTVGAAIKEELAKGSTLPVKVYLDSKQNLYLDDPLQPSLPSMEHDDERMM